VASGAGAATVTGNATAAAERVKIAYLPDPVRGSQNKRGHRKPVPLFFGRLMREPNVQFKHITVQVRVLRETGRTELVVGSVDLANRACSTICFCLPGDSDREFLSLV
jgi:hypothetical protein